MTEAMKALEIFNNVPVCDWTVEDHETIRAVLQNAEKVEALIEHINKARDLILNNQRASDVLGRLNEALAAIGKGE